MILGVVADDLTGATDAGSMSAKAGHLTHVYSATAFGGPDGAKVCVLDTDSRFDEPDVAYAKVRRATERLVAAGARLLHKKTCSVFRGNVGVEFDAMLDAAGEEFAVVVLGFPKNGRTTKGGVHYVHGVPLEQSAFRHDPVHPMTTSRLVEILGGQTRRPVAHLDHTVVARGAESLAEAMSDARGRTGYLILDVVDQAALRTIALAVDLARVRVLCGGSGLIEELAVTWAPPGTAGVPGGTPTVSPQDSPEGSAAMAGDQSEARRSAPSSRAGMPGVLLVAGSLTPQTAAQVEHARQAGVPVMELDTVSVFDDEEAKIEVDRVAAAALAALERGGDVLVRAAAGSAEVSATQAAGMARGLGSAATGRLVSTALAEVAARCLSQSTPAGLVVAGGDTSGTVCARLGLDSFRVGPEIAPGVPVCQSLVPERLSVVLKSGSFGTPDLLVKAAMRLREVQT